MTTQDFISETLKMLSLKRPVFHSEADFQHSLACELQRCEGVSHIRLEKPYDVGGESLCLDLEFWWNSKQKVAVELKYKTDGTVLCHGDERYNLKNHSAYPLGRYDAINDIVRLESLVAEKGIDVGYLIFLTNAKGYWEGMKRESKNTESLEIRDGYTLKGTVGWKEGASIKSIHKTRIDNLKLNGTYTLAWSVYSDVSNEKFRVLIVEVGE